MSIQRKIYLTASEESSGSHRPKCSAESHNSHKRIFGTCTAINIGTKKALLIVKQCPIFITEIHKKILQFSVKYLW